MTAIKRDKASNGISTNSMNANCGLGFTLMATKIHKRTKSRLQCKVSKSNNNSQTLKSDIQRDQHQQYE